MQIIGRATPTHPARARARFTNLIAEPDASEEAVAEAVNDTLKAIAASLLMEQVLAPRFNFRPKTPDSLPARRRRLRRKWLRPGEVQHRIRPRNRTVPRRDQGTRDTEGKEAERICNEDLNEVIAAFAQDKVAVERGLFDEELVPEELTQVRMGKIVQERYPELSEADQEAVRQHAVAALNLTQKAMEAAENGSEESGAQPQASTALIDGVRKFAMDVRDLDIDLIDRINPFGEAYAILAKTMSEESLKQVAAIITAKKVQLTPDEARELAQRALRFKREHGRLPSLTSTDAWEKRMAEGVAFLARMKAEAING